MFFGFAILISGGAKLINSRAILIKANTYKKNQSKHEIYIHEMHLNHNEIPNPNSQINHFNSS